MKSVQIGRHRRHPWPRRMVSEDGSGLPRIAGLALWFDAADASTITQSGGSISQWGNKADNTRNAIQVTALNQPTLQVAALNSLNSVLFTAANAQKMSFPALALNAGGYTFLGVIRKAAGTTFEGFGSSAVPLATLPEWFGTNNLLFFDLGTQEVYTNSGVVSTGYNVVSCFNAGPIANSGIFFNGASQVLAQNSLAYNVTAIDQLGAGDNLTCDGSMAEMLFYNKILSTTDRQSIEAYLKKKWGTP